MLVTQVRGPFPAGHVISSFESKYCQGKGSAGLTS